MGLDQNTLFFAAGICSLAVALTILSVWYQNSHDRFLLWGCLGMILLGAGAVLYYAGPWPLATASVVAFSLESIGFLGEGVMSVMFVVWVSEVIGGGAQELGWLMSGQAVGGIAGGIVLAAVSHRFSPIGLYGFAGMIFGLLDLSLFNYPRVIESVWLGVVIIGIAGLPVVAYDTGITTLLQHTVEDLYRGWVFGVMGTLGASLQLVGTLLAGLLGGLLGPLTLLNIQGGSYVLVGVLALVLLPRTMAGEEQAPAVRESAGAMGEETSS